MPRHEIVDTNHYRAGAYINIYCTRQETEKIADATEGVSQWISLFTMLEPTSITIIRGMSMLITWKARNCLKHGKCLGICVCAIPFPFEYDPNNPKGP